jgi:hypothetical protein
LDNDQRKDIFITTGYRKNITDLDFIHYYQGSTYFGDDASKAATREQLLAKVPEIQLRNYAFRNTADLQFQDVSASWGLNELSYANGAAYADLDRDGDLDLIVNNVDAEASLFKNHTREQRQNHYLHINFKGEASNQTGIGAKVKVWIKGKVQVFEHYPVRGYLSSVEAGLHIGLGKAQGIDSLRVIWSPTQEETRYNIAANQTLLLDIRAARPKMTSTSGMAATLFSSLPDLLPYQHQESTDFIDFNQTFALHKMLSKNGPAAATGDLNGDQLQDVLIGGAYQGSKTELFFQQKNGQFSPSGTLPIPVKMEVGALHIFDADKDGDQDVLVVGGSNERPLEDAEAFQPLLFLNTGRGQFSLSRNALPKLRLSSQCIQTLDYDRDGDLDVFLGGRQIPKAYPLPADSYLLRNEGGRFGDVSAQVAPALRQMGMVCDALVLDYDQDRDEDLILVGEWMPLTLMENRSGHFECSRIKHSEGWWNSLAAGDFDGDGDLDFLLGNEGLNTFYRASPAQPIQIAAKDFNVDGQVDPLLGYFIQGKCVPALPRDALSQQMVQFRKKYTRYADYAKVGFADLFSKKDWQGVYRAEAHTLHSAYAENQGKGHFVLKPLPISAQVAPIHGFLVKDVDGDGHLDALASGNFYANEAHLGQQDAAQGIYLQGNGKGEFKVLAREKTGLSIGGDARRSYWIDAERFFTVLNGGAPRLHSVIAH